MTKRKSKGKKSQDKHINELSQPTRILEISIHLDFKEFKILLSKKTM